MAINRPIDHLPQREKVGRPPSSNPVIINELADAWYAKYLADGNDVLDPAIKELPYRASYAGTRCDRQLFYAMSGVEKSNPPTIADSYRFGIGSAVHAEIQAVMGAVPGNWQSEVDVDLRPNVQGSAHADMIEYEDDGTARTVVEVKTRNGFGFKSATVTMREPAEGPQFGAILQGGMIADALGAERLIVAYFSTELFSPSEAKRHNLPSELARFAAEWHYSVPELRPVLDYEYARVARITEAVRVQLRPSRELHDPKIPAGAVVTDPKTGTWKLYDAERQVLDMRTTWFCAYCAHRDTCIADGGAAQSTEVDL